MSIGRGIKKDFQEQFEEMFGKPITEFTRFKDALSQLGTDTTRQRYINELPRFFIAIGKNPDQVIKERAEDIEANKILEADRYEKLVRTHINIMIKEGYAPNTIKTYLSRIMGFFSNTSKRMALDLKVSSFRIPEGTVVKKHRVTNEEAIYIYKIASAGSNTSRNMSILCFAYQNGLDPVDIASLTIEDILDENGQVKAWQYYKKPRSKTGKLWHSAITPEQAHNLENYLAVRGNPPNGKLFTGRKGDLNEIAIEEILRKLVKTAKLKRIRPKDFRDAFKDALVKAKVDVETREALIGHKTGTGRHSYGDSDNLKIRITEGMKKAYTFLMLEDVVTSAPKTETEKIRELKQENQHLKDILANAWAEIRAMKKDMIELKIDQGRTNRWITANTLRHNDKEKLEKLWKEVFGKKKKP